MQKKLMIAGLLALALVIVLVAVYAHSNCLFGLNAHLPLKWQKDCTAAAAAATKDSTKDSFLGAYGRTQTMQTCLTRGRDGRVFNRCTYM